MIIDYYKILGVARTATAKQIKEAYYHLAKKYHPDNNPKDDRSLHKYLLVTQAYSVLGDLDRRLDYAIKLSDEQWQNYKLTEQEKREIRNIVNRK